MADRQIFYDPSGRRRKRFALGLGLFILLNLLTIAALFATIRVVPVQAPLPVALERGVPQKPPTTTLLARTQRELNLAIRRLLGTQPPSPRKVGARRGQPVILQVDAMTMHRDGHRFLLSANGVWLTDTVAPSYLTRL